MEANINKASKVKEEKKQVLCKMSWVKQMVYIYLLDGNTVCPFHTLCKTVKLLQSLLHCFTGLVFYTLYCKQSISFYSSGSMCS